MGLFGLFSNKKKETLDKGLEKTKESVFGKLARAVAGKSTVDDDVLDVGVCYLARQGVKGVFQSSGVVASYCYDGDFHSVVWFCR